MNEAKYRMNTFRKILLKTEFRLFLFFSYGISLVVVWLRSHVWRQVLYTHLIFAGIYSAFFFGKRFLWFFFAPLMALSLPVQNYILKRYLRNFNQNVPAETVIILGDADWFKFQAWIKPNVLKDEIKLLVRLLHTEKKTFSFFPHATVEDVEKIMGDKSIREVYFMGHGDSHSFLLLTDDILYYCDFNDITKYSKDFVHQIHCGTPYGKSLVDYVVPEENRAKCFLFRKKINYYDIKREFKKREAAALSSASAAGSEHN